MADLPQRLVDAAAQAIDRQFGPEKGAKAWEPCARAAVAATLRTVAADARETDELLLNAGWLEALASAVEADERSGRDG